MARGLNRVFLIGALATRPDMRYTPAGLAILDLTLAGQDLQFIADVLDVRDATSSER